MDGKTKGAQIENNFFSLDLSGILLQTNAHLHSLFPSVLPHKLGPQSDTAVNINHKLSYTTGAVLHAKPQNGPTVLLKSNASASSFRLNYSMHCAQNTLKRARTTSCSDQMMETNCITAWGFKAWKQSKKSGVTNMALCLQRFNLLMCLIIEEDSSNIMKVIWPNKPFILLTIYFKKPGKAQMSAGVFSADVFVWTGWASAMPSHRLILFWPVRQLAN